MTRQQAAETLAYLTEAFRADVSEIEAAIWASELADLDADLAGAAARRLVRTVEFFPKIAAFRDAYNAERRARTARQPALPAEQAPRVAPEAFQSGLDAARASLRARSTE